MVKDVVVLQDVRNARSSLETVRTGKQALLVLERLEQCRVYVSQDWKSQKKVLYTPCFSKQIILWPKRPNETLQRGEILVS